MISPFKTASAGEKRSASQKPKRNETFSMTDVSGSIQHKGPYIKAINLPIQYAAPNFVDAVVSKGRLFVYLEKDLFKYINEELIYNEQHYKDVVTGINQEFLAPYFWSTFKKQEIVDVCGDKMEIWSPVDGKQHRWVSLQWCNEAYKRLFPVLMRAPPSYYGVLSEGEMWDQDSDGKFSKSSEAERTAIFRRCLDDAWTPRFISAVGSKTKTMLSSTDKKLEFCYCLPYVFFKGLDLNIRNISELMTIASKAYRNNDHISLPHLPLCGKSYKIVFEEDDTGIETEYVPSIEIAQSMAGIGKRSTKTKRDMDVKTIGLAKAKLLSGFNNVAIYGTTDSDIVQLGSYVFSHDRAYGKAAQPEGISDMIVLDHTCKTLSVFRGPKSAIKNMVTYDPDTQDEISLVNSRMVDTRKNNSLSLSEITPEDYHWLKYEQGCAHILKKDNLSSKYAVKCTESMYNLIVTSQKELLIAPNKEEATALSKKMKQGVEKANLNWSDVVAMSDLCDWKTLEPFPANVPCLKYAEGKYKYSLVSAKNLNEQHIYRIGAGLTYLKDIKVVEVSGGKVVADLMNKH